MSSIQRYQTEKAIIDALLKISEIIKKTNSYSKKATGDGDKKQQHKYETYHTPIPPPMRTLESYVSGFNQKYAMSSSSQRPTNCNQAPTVVWNSREYNKRKKYGHDTSTSSISDNHYRKKSSRKYRSSGSEKRRRMKCACQSTYDDNEYSASDC